VSFLIQSPSERNTLLAGIAFDHLPSSVQDIPEFSVIYMVRDVRPLKSRGNLSGRIDQVYGISCAVRVRGDVCVFGGFTVRGVESAEQRRVQACAEIAGAEPELGGVFLSTELAAVRLRAVSRGVRDAVGIVVGELYRRPGLCVYYTDNVPLIVGDVHVEHTFAVEVSSPDLCAVEASVS